MILVICSTNRPNSKTSIVAEYVSEYLGSQKQNVKYITLEEYAKEIDLSTMYDPSQMSVKMQNFQDQYWIPATKIVVVSPEYNGTFPGVFKIFIDALSVRKYAESFKGKKAALIGVASGRAGNLRGLEQLTGFLNYLKVNVYPVKLPISQIANSLEHDKLTENATKPIDELMNEFVAF